MTLIDLIFFPLPLSLGNHGPLVRRKDLGKFRHSLPQKPALCKPVFVHLAALHGAPCALAGGCLGSLIITETHCLGPGTGRPGCRVAPGEGLLAVSHWMGEHHGGAHFYGMSLPHPQDPAAPYHLTCQHHGIGVLCAPCRRSLGHIQHRLTQSRTVHFWWLLFFSETITQPLYERSG